MSRRTRKTPKGHCSYGMYTFGHLGDLEQPKLAGTRRTDFGSKPSGLAKVKGPELLYKFGHVPGVPHLEVHNHLLHTCLVRHRRQDDLVRIHPKRIQDYRVLGAMKTF